MSFKTDKIIEQIKTMLPYEKDELFRELSYVFDVEDFTSVMAREKINHLENKISILEDDIKKLSKQVTGTRKLNSMPKAPEVQS
jgi:ribosomal protein L7/L12